MIAVTGPRGLLGSHLVKLGAVPLEANICNLPELARAVRHVNPDVIIHCAAFTGVDRAETEAIDCMRVNVMGTLNLHRAFHGRIIHLSTDYIFDGKDGPYREDAVPNPLGVYGLSKLMSEWALEEHNDCLIVRTTILYGWGKPNFVTHIIQQLRAGKTVRVSDGLVGNPTYVPSLAKALMQLAIGTPNGVMNVAGPDRVSRYEFARRIATSCNLEPNIEILYDHPGAKRPMNAGFVLRKFYGEHIPMMSIQDALADMRRTE